VEVEDWNCATSMLFCKFRLEKRSCLLGQQDSGSSSEEGTCLSNCAERSGIVKKETAA